jgi:hypothetical protein
MTYSSRARFQFQLSEPETLHRPEESDQRDRG